MCAECQKEIDKAVKAYDQGNARAVRVHLKLWDITRRQCHPWITDVVDWLNKEKEQEAV